MTDSHTEQLIRDAFAEEAARAGDPREVLAAVRGRRPRRSYGLVLAAAAVVVVVAAVATFVVPEVFRRSSPPPVGEQRQEQTTAVTPTNVLLVGTDESGHTDSVALIQVGADGSVGLASLPRDAWFKIDDDWVRLNQLYTRDGVDALLRGVQVLTGVAVEHYVAVDMTVLKDIVNAVGGVKVCLNTAVSDKFSGANLPAGESVLNGDAALAFLRQRHGLPNGDLDRIVRLQAFLRSLAVQLKADPGKAPAVIRPFLPRVKFDQGLDVVGFVTDVLGATSLHVGTIPIENLDLRTPEGGAVIGVDPGAVQQFVTELPSTPPTTGVPCVN